MKSEFYNKLPAMAKNIRKAVFIDEQKFKNEFDDIDNTAIHLVIFDDKEKAVGTARMFKTDDKTVCFGRIAILKEERKNHYGSFILKELERKAKEMGYKKIELSAQERIKDFYKKNGYTEIGDTYFDEYCRHIKMYKYI